MLKLFKLTMEDASGKHIIHFTRKQTAKVMRKAILDDPDREPGTTVSCVQRGPHHWKGETF